MLAAMTEVTAAGAATAGNPRERIRALDSLRGFALCGILLVNIYQTLDMREPPRWLELFFEHRFFGIFSLLFGIGFGIFLDRAAARTDRPRVLLVRRLAVLAGFGGLHLLLQPGEVLLLYAVCGLVFLLPASFLPRRATLLLGLVLLGVAVAFAFPAAWVPGLFVLGLALARYDVPRRLPPRTGLLAALTAGLTAVSLAAYTVGGVGGDDPGKLAVLLPLPMSAAYATGLLLVLRTPLGRPVSAVLAPLGRMALTNYLTATILFVPVGHLLGLAGSTRWGTAVALAAAILVLQAAVSPLWLRGHRYGPLEWVWRCATWARRFPLRRGQPEQEAAGEVVA
jgi:uncharacterized protein